MRSILLLTSAVIAGCASVTEPVRIGPETLLVNSRVSGTFYGWGGAKNMSIEKANEYCDKLGKVMVIEGEDYSGAMGWTPIEAHIKFKCQDKQAVSSKN